MIFSDDRTSKDALLNTLGGELAAAWARFYAIEVDRQQEEGQASDVRRERGLAESKISG
jgi:hypothetical protein